MKPEQCRIQYLWANSVLSFRHHSERLFFFFFAFYFKVNILFWLTISYQKPFVFSVSVFCFQIFTLKLKFRPKFGLIYAISIVKWFFGFFFFLRKYFFYFLYWIWIIDVSQRYCETFRNIETAELVENLPPPYIPYRFLYNLHSFLPWLIHTRIWVARKFFR